jgi:hypothetical protein
MTDEHQKSNAGGCLAAIIILAIIGWLAYKVYDNYKYGEKKQFWKGT